MNSRRRNCAIAAAACGLVIVAGLTAPATAAGQTPQVVPRPRSTTGVTFYPILAELPIFGATIDIPPGDGGESGTSGTTDVSLNGAYLFGVIVETDRWLADANGLWAALGASRSLPLTRVDTDITFFNVMGGVRIVNGLFAIGGVRRIGADLDVTMTAAVTNSTLSGGAKRTAWDPMIGLEYRGQLHRRLRFEVTVKGGGFGVGTDIDLASSTAVDWEFARHFVLRAGYQFVYYKWTIDDAEIESVNRTLISKQTLHGPEIGIGIRF